MLRPCKRRNFPKGSEISLGQNPLFLGQKILFLRQKLGVLGQKQGFPNFPNILNIRNLFYSELSKNYKKMILKSNFGNQEKLIPIRKLTLMFGLKFGMQGIRREVAKVWREIFWALFLYLWLFWWTKNKMSETKIVLKSSCFYVPRGGGRVPMKP